MNPEYGIERAGLASGGLRLALRSASSRSMGGLASRALAVRALPFILIALGLAVRIVPWWANYPLHRDEALYGQWARLISSGQDPLLLTAWVDKPPLVPYLLAISLQLFGVSELALRLPGMIAGVMTLGVLYACGRRAYGQRTALIAVALLAASPFAILFGPTAFTDPWLALFLAAAVWAALAGRPFWAGLGIGLAIASKQQGILGVPLVVALVFWQVLVQARAIPRSGRPAHPTWVLLLLTTSLLIAGVVLVIGPVSYWDSLRWSNRPSFWEHSISTYGGIGLASVGVWPVRAAGWAQLLGYLFGSPGPSAAILGLAAVAGLAGATVGPRRDGFPGLGAHTRNAGTGGPGEASRTRWLDLGLGSYVAFYLAAHFVSTVQAWDRYLLPVVPLICLLAASGMQRTWGLLGGWRSNGLARPAAVAALGLLLAFGSWKGISASVPVGSDHGAYYGMARVVAELRSQPRETVIYDHSLGWFYGFYMFGAHQEVRWWDSAWKLADDAARTALAEPKRSQLLALPGWEDEEANKIRLALAGRRLGLQERLRTYRPDGTRSFTLYQILPEGKGDAS